MFMIVKSRQLLIALPLKVTAHEAEDQVQQFSSKFMSHRLSRKWPPVRAGNILITKTGS